MQHTQLMGWQTISMDEEKQHMTFIIQHVYLVPHIHEEYRKHEQAKAGV